MKAYGMCMIALAAKQHQSLLDKWTPLWLQDAMMHCMSCALQVQKGLLRKNDSTPISFETLRAFSICIGAFTKQASVNLHHACTSMLYMASAEVLHQWG